MEMKEKIVELIRSGHRTEAIRLLEEWGQERMEDEALLLQWGELLYADGKMTEALNKFNAVLRLNPEHSKARNYVTMINSILGYYCKDLLNP